MKMLAGDLFIITYVSVSSLITLSTVLSLGLISAFLVYYLRKLRPYYGFPIYYLDLHIISWILKKREDKNVSLLTHIVKKIAEIGKKYEKEGLFVATVGKPFVFVYGEEVIRALMKDSAAKDKSSVYKNFEFFLRKGIFTSNGEVYKDHKKLINPSFHGAALKDLLQLVNQYAVNLIKQMSDIEGQSTEKATDYIKNTSLRIFLDSTLGIKSEKKVDDVKLRRFIRAMTGLSRVATTRIFSPWLQWDYLLPFFPYTRKGLEYEKDFRDFITEQLKDLEEVMRSQESRANLDNNESSVKLPFAQFLIDKHFEDSKFTMDNVYDQFASVIFAGSSTVTTVLMWSLFMLGLHPEVQEQVYNEVKTMTNGDVTYDDIPKLKYLDCVMKEILRLYSTVPAISRRLEKDIQVGKYKIPKNSNIVVMMYMINQNPNIFPDPEKFILDRFMQDDAKDTSRIFIPFAEGLRPCIGKNYAILQIKILLCHILKNFKVVSLERKEDVAVSWEVILVFPKRPRLQFTQRET